MNRIEGAQAPPSLDSIAHETTSDPADSIVVLYGHDNLRVRPQAVDALFFLGI